MCVYRTREIREFNSSLKKASSSPSSSAAVTLTDCSNTINYNLTFIFIYAVGSTKSDTEKALVSHFF